MSGQVIMRVLGPKDQLILESLARENAAFDVDGRGAPQDVLEPAAAEPTLEATTTPGATWTASVVYSAGRSPVSFPNVAEVADANGHVSWSWHEETTGHGGTADVTCSLNGQSMSASASFTVTGSSPDRW